MVDDPKSQILKKVHKALEEGDPQRAAEELGEFITLGERSGKLTREQSSRLRLDLATEMIKIASHVPVREKVTLSLPSDVLKALRLASAESNKEMSEVVAEALRKELKKYPHALQALLK